MDYLTQWAGFIGKEKDRYAMTYGGEPQRLSIVGTPECAPDPFPAPDADVAVSIREGVSKDDALKILIKVMVALHGDAEFRDTVALHDEIQKAFADYHRAVEADTRRV
jgi:hypothetical protein